MVSRKKYIPKRGDLVWVSFNPRSGHEQAGRCPAAVLSPLAYNNKAGLAIMCPITSQIKGYPFEVIIPDKLTIAGVILSDQIKNLDWRERNAEYICSLPNDIISEVLQKLIAILTE